MANPFFAFHLFTCFDKALNDAFCNLESKVRPKLLYSEIKSPGAELSGRGVPSPPFFIKLLLLKT